MSIQLRQIYPDTSRLKPQYQEAVRAQAELLGQVYVVFVVVQFLQEAADFNELWGWANESSEIEVNGEEAWQMDLEAFDSAIGCFGSAFRGQLDQSLQQLVAAMHDEDAKTWRSLPKVYQHELYENLPRRLRPVVFRSVETECSVDGHAELMEHLQVQIVSACSHELRELERTRREFRQCKRQIEATTIGASGAVRGMVVGSMLAPGLGTVIGGALGGLFSAGERDEKVGALSTQAVEIVNTFMETAYGLMRKLDLRWGSLLKSAGAALKKVLNADYGQAAERLAAAGLDPDLVHTIITVQAKAGVEEATLLVSEDVKLALEQYRS